MALATARHAGFSADAYLARAGQPPLKHALIRRFGTLCRVNRGFLLQSDILLSLTCTHQAALVRDYGLKREFITSTACRKMAWPNA